MRCLLGVGACVWCPGLYASASHTLLFSARYGHGFVYETPFQRFFLFGGASYTQVFNDDWVVANTFSVNTLSQPELSTH